jgi:hypothetical protein
MPQPIVEPEIRTRNDQRRDGRPTGTSDEGLQPGADHGSVPTVAPEEEGGSPSTEHAPGADL